jgi:hypothetical protein
MTQKEQNIIVDMIEELTVWEARMRERRGELIEILKKEKAPRPKRKREELIDVEAEILGRHARKMANQRKHF